MGRSSLLGIDRADLEPDGRDTATLGPGDTSDSGSDMAGAENLDNTDPSAPLDVALADDVQRTYAPVDDLHGAPSDASGTGERRSAGSDAGLREAADISVDRVFDPDLESDGLDDDGLPDDEDPDLAFVDRAEAGAVLADEDAAEGEDDDVDIGDRMSAEDAAAAPPSQQPSVESDDAAEGDVEGDGERRTSGDDDGVEGGASEDDPDSDVERAGLDRDIQQGGPRGATRR